MSRRWFVCRYAIPAYLLSIDPRKVKPEVRFKLEIYQEECDEALWNYWNEGHAVNPRAADPNEMILSKDRYIELLEAENRLLKQPKPVRRTPTPLTNELICRIYDLLQSGLSGRAVAAELGISTATVSFVRKLRPIIPPAN